MTIFITLFLGMSTLLSLFAIFVFMCAISELCGSFKKLCLNILLFVSISYIVGLIIQIIW